MKLGIIVVYLFDENTEYLLHLHLDYIRRFTDVPYTIYGSVARLSSEGRQKLSEYPEVQQCEIPPTHLRWHFEHAYYLDHLAEIAVREGSTHLVTLHLDSFPVCPGWVQKLKALTEQTGSCAVLDDYYTACLFFTKDFYLSFRPKFSGVVEANTQADYVTFSNKYKIWNHSGALYLYACHVNQLSWHVLKNSTGESSHKFCDVFGGMIFHLKSAVGLSVDSQNAKESKPNEIKLRKLVISWITFLGRHLTTLKMRDWIRKNLSNSPFCVFEKWLMKKREVVAAFELESRLKAERIEMESAIATFMENSEAYLDKLQNSSKVLDAIQRFE